jgi:hypothetical protein
MFFYRKWIMRRQCGITAMTSGKKIPTTSHLQQFCANRFAKRLSIPSGSVHLKPMRRLSICAQDHAIKRQ